MELEARMGTSYAEGVTSAGGQRKWKICGVCGDRAKSFHFGGISCDSCKAFFRRSVQNDGFRSFRCAFHGHCDITVANRKCCQHCRFHRCITIGMETRWVMSEDERVHLTHSRTSSRHLYHRLTTSGHSLPVSAQLFPPADQSVITSGGQQEGPEVDALVLLFNSNFVPEVGGLQAEMTLDFVCLVQKLVSFARQIPRFSRLGCGVQVALLRANIFEMSVVLHLVSGGGGGGGGCIRSKDGCYLCSFLGQAGSLCVTLRDCVTDTPTLVLLLMVILFSADSLPPSVDDRPQLHFCRLLERHFRCHFRATPSSFLLARLLLLLPTLREIRDRHLSLPVQLEDKRHSN